MTNISGHILANNDTFFMPLYHCMKEKKNDDNGHYIDSCMMQKV